MSRDQGCCEQVILMPMQQMVQKQQNPSHMCVHAPIQALLGYLPMKLLKARIICVSMRNAGPAGLP